MTSRMSSQASFGNAGSPFNMFFASLLLHLIVLAAVMISVPGVSRQLTLGAPYSVSLVGPEILQTPLENSSGTKGLLPDLPTERPTILKQETGIAKSVSIFKKVDNEKADIEKAISALRQKNLSSAEEIKTTKAPAAAQTSGAANASSQNQSKINDYSRFIWTRIKKNWTLPATLMPKSNVETIIEVRILQSGALDHIGFEKRSGNRYFDESALRAVKKSAPFPPLSGWVTDRSIEMGIRFHSDQLR